MKPVQVLVSQPVFTAVEGDVKAEELGEVELGGFHRQVAIYNARELKTRSNSG